MKNPTRSFFDASQSEDMQLQVYSLLARYIEEAGFYIDENNPHGLFKTLQKIYPCIHTRLQKEIRFEIKQEIDEIRDKLFSDQCTDEELTFYMDKLYELYCKLQETMQHEGITIRVRTDPSSIVTR